MQGILNRMILLLRLKSILCPLKCGQAFVVRRAGIVLFLVVIGLGIEKVSKRLKPITFPLASWTDLRSPAYWHRPLVQSSASASKNS